MLEDYYLAPGHWCVCMKNVWIFHTSVYEQSGSKESKTFNGVPGFDLSSRGLTIVFLHTPLDDLLPSLSPSRVLICSPFTLFFSPSPQEARDVSILSGQHPNVQRKAKMRDVRKSWLVSAPALYSPLTLTLTLSMTLGPEVVWTRRRWDSLPTGWWVVC